MFGFESSKLFNTFIFNCFEWIFLFLLKYIELKIGIFIWVSWAKNFTKPLLNLIIAWTYDFGWIKILNFFLLILNILWASITSNTLFIKFVESIEIFLPIDQFGCLIASFGFIFFKLLVLLFKNGPPEAVSIISSILALLTLFINDHIEKCSESIGIKLVLFFFNFFFIIFQLQIIDSLFAIPTVLLYLIASRVGFNPDNPEIEHMV